MKAVIPLAFLLLAGLCAAGSQYNNRRFNDNDDQQQDDTADNDSQRRSPQKAEPFRAGKEYTFTYNGQIASGIDVSGPSNSPASNGEQLQKAVMRIQAQAQITFGESEERAVLRLSKVRLGQLNEQIESPQQVQPMGKFDRKDIDSDKQRKLEQPVQFSYNNGLVQDIQFTSEDSAWSKNIKRAVLNMIQVNLQRRTTQAYDSQEEQGDSAEQQQEQDGQIPLKSFVVPEITIEGQCETTYTINNNKQQQQSPSFSSDNDEDEQQSGKTPSFNVTKSIDFKKCQQIADVAFGYQTQSQQPRCGKCKQQQQQEDDAAPQKQSQACKEECDPKEVRDNKLDRSTVLRFVLVGKGPQQKYGIKRAELFSQYTYKNMRADAGPHSSTMQTVVVAELVFRSAKPASGQQQHKFHAADNNQKNTLLYDNEWDVEEKRFYMYGDDQNERGSPFANMVGKLEHVQAGLRRLAQAASDKINGIESSEAQHLQRLVELLRMCSVSELRKLASEMNQQGSQMEQKKVAQIFADALAIAGTKNTIQVLSEKILNEELTPKEAAQALKSLTGLPAPSDKQVDIVLHLCQNQAISRKYGLKQTCWLTFGSMVGELCQHRTQKGDKSEPIFGAQSGYSSSHQCQPSKKEHYKQALLKQFSQAQNAYEKILALKAVGNAGIDTAVQTLEKIINDNRENVVVRMQAVDSLRRLRNQMPRKIQRILLPVLQNTREYPGMRMVAFAMIMHTSPQQPIVDQVLYVLSKERQPQVQSFVYATLKALSQSKAPEQQQMAKHLQNTLKLTNINEQTLQSGHNYQVPVYSSQQKEGAFLNLIAASVKRSNILPNHLQARLDTLINDEFDQSLLQVTFSQLGIEQWYEGIIQSLLQSNKRGGSPVRGQRSSINDRMANIDELRNVFKGLKVSKRRNPYQQEESDEEQQNQQQQNRPFAMLTVRVADLDTAVVAMDRQSMPQCIKNLAYGKRISIADCLTDVQGGSQNFRILAAMNLNEKQAKIPTSAGIPLRILQSVPVMATVDAEVRASSDRNSEESGSKMTVNLHPSACIVHIQKMEAWTPLIASGVSRTQAVELNIPIGATVQVNSQAVLKATVKIPPAGTRLIGLHTLPATYIREFDRAKNVLKDTKEVKAIQVPQLEQLQRDVDYTIGQHTTGMPIRIQGHVHRPSDPTNYVELAQLAMCTENHLHVKYQPHSDESPQEIELSASVLPFSKPSIRGQPAFDNFYSKQNAFDSAEQSFEDEESHDQRRSKLNTLMQSSRFQPAYKHSIKLGLKTKGGRKELNAQMQAKSSCDAKFKYCQIELEAERSPLYPQEKSQWTMQSKLQILRPEAVSNVQQLQQQDADKNQKLIVLSDSLWGSQHKQSIVVRVQGQKAHTTQWRNQIEQSRGPQSNYQKKQAAFINKYDVTAEYKLKPEWQNLFQRAFDMLQNYAGFWNTQVEQSDNGSDGTLRATVVIDPITQQHANITIKTATQTMRIQSTELPTKMRLFPLVRPAEKSSHSTIQLFSRMAMGSGRAECSVDGKRVETFDDVLYKAPIGKCYSVLAKDCSNDDQPQFAVMMKTLANGQDKKIKVITPEQTIECKPSGSQQSRKLKCSIDGQTVEQGDEQQNTNAYGNPTVEYNNEEQTDVQINVEGVQVRFGCWGSSSCKNQKAWIKLSSQYKDAQCGLCGHYDEDADNELRTANDELTTDVKLFHRSFSLRGAGDDEECTTQEQDSFYSTQNDRRFRQISDDEDQSEQNDDESDEQNDGSVSRRRKQKSSWEQDNDDEQDNQWQAGAYHTDGSSSEEDQWGNTKMHKMWKKKQSRQQQGNDEKNPTAPIPMTKTLEYNHKVCFSVNPVKQCPPGTYAVDDKQNKNEQAKKIQFACLPRTDPKARQLQRQARKGLVADMSGLEPSFVEDVSQPRKCAVY